MTAPQAAELAATARVEELVLIHFAPRYKGRYQQLVDEARSVFPRTWAELDDPEILGPTISVEPQLRGGKRFFQPPIESEPTNGTGCP